MNIITISIAALIYLFYQAADAWGDVAIELGHQQPWHTWGAVQAGMFIAVLAFALCGWSWCTVIVSASLVVLRFPIFNLMHNAAKGQRWCYLSDNGIDGLIKKLLSWLT
ncbi:MAG TPA: hypothetical protein PKH58_01360 [Paludibacteraceae bacterium]|nr:hypothetical protein [Paludibacteraceae bacterium]